MMEPRKDLGKGLKQPFASPTLQTEALKAAEALVTKHPSFVKPMHPSNVSSGFWLNLPSTFCFKHMDITEREWMTLEDTEGLKWNALCLGVRGISAGWRRFSVQHKLVAGDALVFELVSKLKFKVHIFRAVDFQDSESNLEPKKTINEGATQHTKLHEAKPHSVSKGKKQGALMSCSALEALGEYSHNKTDENIVPEQLQFLGSHRKNSITATQPTEVLGTPVKSNGQFAASLSVKRFDKTKRADISDSECRMCPEMLRQTPLDAGLREPHIPHRENLFQKKTSRLREPHIPIRENLSQKNRRVRTPVTSVGSIKIGSTGSTAACRAGEVSVDGGESHQRKRMLFAMSDIVIEPERGEQSESSDSDRGETLGKVRKYFRKKCQDQLRGNEKGCSALNNCPQPSRVRRGYGDVNLNTKFPAVIMVNDAATSDILAEAQNRKICRVQGRMRTFVTEVWEKPVMSEYP